MRRIPGEVRRQNMKADVPLHDFRHQAIQRPAAGRHEVQNAGAILLGLERPLERLDLSPNAPNSDQQLIFSFGCVCHAADIPYPPMVLRPLADTHNECPANSLAETRRYG